MPGRVCVNGGAPSALAKNDQPHAEGIEERGDGLEERRTSEKFMRKEMGH